VPALSGAVSFAGRSDRAIAQELMRVHGVEPSDANWQRFRSAYLEVLPGALRRRQGRVLPGVTSLLTALGAVERSVVGLLTGNVREGAARKLRYYGLADHFPFGGFGDDTDERCEIASMALAEARRFAAGRNGHTSELAGVMVIGDTEHDIRCARSIGAVAVAVPTGGATREVLAAAQPDLLLDDLSDARPLLELIAGGK